MTVQPAARTGRSSGPVWWVPCALVALVVVPAVAGSLRLAELAGGPGLMPEDPRLTASPVPVAGYIIRRNGCTRIRTTAEVGSS